MITIIENAIPVAAQKEALALLTSTQFAWFYHANTNYGDAETRENDTPQFCHGFIRDNKYNSPHCAIPLGILSCFNLGMEHIIRAKANYMVQEPKPFLNPKHTDDNQTHIVFIYYANDSDGDTHIWEENGTLTTVSPKRGRGVFFSGSLLHASMTPVKNKNRIVINFNLKSDALDWENLEQIHKKLN